MRRAFRLQTTLLYMTAVGVALIGCARNPYSDITPEQAKAVAKGMRPALPPLGKLPPGQRGKPIIITMPPPPRP